jgi:hypothetical protein
VVPLFTHELPVDVVHGPGLPVADALRVAGAGSQGIDNEEDGATGFHDRGTGLILRGCKWHH